MLPDTKGWFAMEYGVPGRERGPIQEFDVVTSLGTISGLRLPSPTLGKAGGHHELDL